MKPGIQYEFRSAKVTVGSRLARGGRGHFDSHPAGDLERAVPLFSWTMQQGSWVPLLF